MSTRVYILAHGLIQIVVSTIDALLEQAIDSAIDSARDIADYLALALASNSSLASDSDRINTLNAYLRATKLYLDCLQLASVSDREALEDALLRPPPQGERGG